MYQRHYLKYLVPQRGFSCTKGIIKVLGTAERLLVYQSLSTFTDRHPQGRKIKWQILVTCKICHLPFFCPSVSSCLCSFGLRCFDKPSDRRKSIQSSGHKKDIPFLKILVTCKISKRGCPSYTYKYVFLLSIGIPFYFSVSPLARRRAPGSGCAPRKER